MFISSKFLAVVISKFSFKILALSLIFSSLSLAQISFANSDCGLLTAADWDTRSTASGVVMSSRFDNETEVLDYVHQDSAKDNVTWDSNLKSSGNGSIRIAILKTDHANSGSWRRHLKDDQGDFKEGDTFYVQYRQYVPQYYRDHPFKGTFHPDGFAGGWKSSITSHMSGSNQLFEVVIQNSNHVGYVQGYNRNSLGGYPPWDVQKPESPCGSPDFVKQNMIDHGGEVNTCLDARRRWGGSQYGYPGQTGAPDPETGAFLYYPDEWLTYLQEVTIGTFGNNDLSVKDSRVRLWAARQNDSSYTLLIDREVNLGRGTHRISGEQIYFNALWLLPYNTDREPDPTREDTYTNYDEVIVSTECIRPPSASTPGDPPGSPAAPSAPQNLRQKTTN